MRAIFREYGGTISPDTISARKFSEGGTSRSDLMDFPGTRMLITSETDETTVLSEAFIKVATGGDTLKHRGLYQARERELRIGAKLWYATNHKPIIRGIDEAIWRRPCVIPFTVAIPEGQRFPKYESLLLEEGPGILNWMLVGLKKIYDNGGRLKQHDKIRNATSEYRNESDTIGRFISECLIFEPGVVSSHADLYELYEGWRKEEQETPATTKKFYAALREKGIRDGAKSKNIRYIHGIRRKKAGEEEVRIAPGKKTKNSSTLFYGRPGKKRANPYRPGHAGSLPGYAGICGMNE